MASGFADRAAPRTASTLAVHEQARLRPPEHSTMIGSNLGSDMRYDQIMFFPGDTNAVFTGQCGVVDFDGAVFRTLWNTKTK
jgi:hypothetical protein